MCRENRSLDEAQRNRGILVSRTVALDSTSLHRGYGVGRAGNALIAADQWVVTVVASMQRSAIEAFLLR